MQRRRTALLVAVLALTSCHTVPRPAALAVPASAPVEPPSEKACGLLAEEARKLSARITPFGELLRVMRSARHRADAVRFGRWAEQVPVREVLEPAGRALMTDIGDAYVSLSDGLAGLAGAVNDSEGEVIAEVLEQVRGQLTRAGEVVERVASRCGLGADALRAKATPLGEVPLEVAHRVVEQGEKARQSCLDEARRRLPALAGQLVVAVEVDEGGAVRWLTDATDATDAMLPMASLADPDVIHEELEAIVDPTLVDCLLDAFEALRFPAPEGGPAQLLIPVVVEAPPPAS